MSCQLLPFAVTEMLNACTDVVQYPNGVSELLKSMHAIEMLTEIAFWDDLIGEESECDWSN